MTKPVVITKRPESVEIQGLEIVIAGCSVNSYRVAVKNPAVQLVEGFLISVPADGMAQHAAHVWNRLGDIHFDVTGEEIWDGHPENTALELRYVEVTSYPHTRYKEGEAFRFSDETEEEIVSFKRALNGLEQQKNAG